VQLLVESTSHKPSASGGLELVAVEHARRVAGRAAAVPAWIHRACRRAAPGTTTINFTVAANPDPYDAHCQHHHRRSRRYGLAGRAASCSFLVEIRRAYTRRRPAARARFDVNTTAGCGWTSSGVPAWITGCGERPRDDKTINFTVAPIPIPTPRTANITIGGQTFMVSQAAASCSLLIESDQP
jgi:hypothetical protein